MVNQIIVEIETAKAMVELPCPFEGVVAGLLVGEGETVDVGTPIISVDVSGGAGEMTAAAGGYRTAAAGRFARRACGRSGPARHRRRGSRAVYPCGRLRTNPACTAAPRRSRNGSRCSSGTGSSSARPPAGRASQVRRGIRIDPGATAPRRASHLRPQPTQPASRWHPGARCSPSLRCGSWPGNSGSTWPPSKAPGQAGPLLAPTCRRRPARRAAPGLVAAAPALAAAIVGAGAGPREERVAVRGVRKHTAAAVVASAFTAPHVTEFLQVDLTATMEASQRVRDLPEFEGVRVSPLLFVAKALLLAVARNPMINSSWDDAAAEIVVKRYVNLGIAAATERGLIVPNIKDAHALPLPALARALSGLAETARAGKTTLADLQDGTITISNVGVFGVDSGTPILTPGEAAILAFGQVREMPWVHEAELAVRKVCTLALSFDHRIVDGDLGSAVLRDVGAMLEEPVRMLAWA